MKITPLIEFHGPNAKEAVAELSKTLSGESDRGCALVVASILDTALEDLLRSSFVNNPDLTNNMLGQMRPLGTFSARIDISYLLGLISIEMHRDLHLIRKVRNDFGHTMKALSFEDPLIRPRCLEIQTMAETPMPIRDKFRFVAMWILGAILGATSTMQHKSARDLPTPKHLHLPE